MAKPIKTILSRSAIRFGERIERTRALSEQLSRDEIRREETLTSPDGGSDVTNGLAQAGRRLARQVFVHRVRRLNPALWYEQSLRYPDRGALYIDDPVRGKRMICGLPHEIINEFSTRITTPKIIPDPVIAGHWRTIQAVDQQEPGWRTLLLKLIMDGLVSPSGVEREFQITKGRSSQKWQAAMH